MRHKARVDRQNLTQSRWVSVENLQLSFDPPETLTTGRSRKAPFFIGHHSNLAENAHFIVTTAAINLSRHVKTA